MTENSHTRGKAAAVFLALLLLAAFARAQQHPPAANSRAEALQTLATRFSPAGREGRPVKCGLPFLSAAIRERATLGAGQQLALNSLLQRPDLQTSILADGGRFRFHFDTTGTQAPALLDSAGRRVPGTARAFVDSAIAIMTHVYHYETDTLGFQAPPGDGTLGGGPEYDIYIDDPGPDTYGLTTPETGISDGGISQKFSTFIEVHYDFSFVTPPANRGIPSLRVTLAHEFHHAIQIGSYGYWTSDIWFHEITSVWMEDVVYHGENDYLNYLFGLFGPSQFTSPGTPLTTNDFIEYSRGILGKYLTKRFGHDTMLHIWQNIRQLAPLPAINLTLQQLPVPLTSSMSLAFAEWALWNYYTGPRSDTVNYYNEAAIFPVMVEQYYDMISPSQQVSSSLSCLATAYYGFVRGTDTVTVALANLNTDCPAYSSTSSPYTLTVSRNRPDDSYRSIAGDLYLRLDVANPSQWVTWAISRQGPSANSLVEGSAFPNPFHPGEGDLLYMPANADQGRLAVYSTGMELVYSGSFQTQWRLGQRVISWNGMTKGNSAAPTGIYLFVLTLPGRTVTGKFAVVRR